MAGTGIPFTIKKISDIEISFDVSDSLTEEPVFHRGDEIMYLNAERISANYIDDKTWDRHFCIEKLTDRWNSMQYYQEGVLAVYFELDTETNVLSFWVVTSGGQNGKTHPAPKWEGERLGFGSNGVSWENRWNSYLKSHVAYVSHASWKLENIPQSGSSYWNN